jgi:DNA-binding NarL/FixJ family response regulator
VLFIGEPPTRDLDADDDRLYGAVSTQVEPSQLEAAIGALANGLQVVDPVLSQRAAISLGTAAMATPDVENPLTPRERQVLDLVARGYPNKSIAYELGISEHTAKFHVGSLLTKLEAASRAEVVTNATRRGLLSV